jgi:hypothetical protein
MDEIHDRGGFGFNRGLHYQLSGGVFHARRVG